MIFYGYEPSGWLTFSHRTGHPIGSFTTNYWNIFKSDEAFHHLAQHKATRIKWVGSSRNYSISWWSSLSLWLFIQGKTPRLSWSDAVGAPGLLLKSHSRTLSSTLFRSLWREHTRSPRRSQCKNIWWVWGSVSGGLPCLSKFWWWSYVLTNFLRHLPGLVWKRRANPLP